MKHTLRAGGALLGLLFSLALAGTVHAAVEYTVTPSAATVRSGSSINYTVTKNDNGTVSDVTNQAVFSVTDPSGIIAGTRYFGGTVGTWTVTATVAATTTTTDVTVTPGEAARLRITPNDEPVKVETGKTIQFTATTYDSHNNVVDNQPVEWSGAFSLGTISDTGLFTASTPGSSHIVATNGTIIDTVTIRVVSPVAETPVTTNTNTASADTNSGAATDAGANTNSSDEGIGATTDSTSEEPVACTTMPWWAWLGITVAFLGIIYGYHYFIRKKRSSLWLIGTAAATAAVLWLYFSLRCGSQFTWVAWVIAIGAGILTVLRPQTFQTNYGSEV